MIYDLQKASVLKRISAWLLDLILLLVSVVGFAVLISTVVGFDDYAQGLEERYSHYEEAYGITFEITQEEYDALTPEKREAYDEASAALTADKEAIRNYNMIINLTLVMVSLGVLLGYLLLEFVVPLFLKNGQTIGKKAFGIAVIRSNGVRANGICLFIRTFLGKYTLETMVPVLIVVMLLFGMIGMLGTIVIMGLAIAQAVLLIVHCNRSVIHDLLADTVAVDLNSQMIFDTEEELLEYKKRMSAEEAAKQSYY